MDSAPRGSAGSTTPPASPAFDVTRNVRLLYAHELVSGLVPFLPIWVLYLTDFRGLTLAQVGLLEGFFWGVAIVAEMPTGAFADRFGRRLTFLAALLVQAGGLALFGLADGYVLLYLSYVLWALGLSLASGNDQAYLYEALAADGRAEQFSAVAGRLMAARMAAAMVGAIGGGWLASAATLQAPVLLTVVTFLASVPIVLAMREPPRAQRAAPLTYTQTLRGGGRALRADRASAAIVLFSVSFAVLGGAGAVLSQPFLQRHGVPLAAFGLFFGPMQLIAILGALTAYRLPRLLGLSRSLGLLWMVPAAAYLLMGVVDHVVAFAGFALRTMAWGMREPLTADYLNRRTASEVRATVLSAQPLGRAVLQAVVTPRAGRLRLPAERARVTARAVWPPLPAARVARLQERAVLRR